MKNVMTALVPLLVMMVIYYKKLGCSEDCQYIERSYECPTPGKLCNKICGNGKIDNYKRIIHEGNPRVEVEETIDEACDDSNEANDDGCNDKCQIEEGYTCPIEGKLCEHACGNRILDSDGIPGFPNYKEDCDPFIIIWNDDRTKFTKEMHKDYIQKGCTDKCKYTPGDRDYVHSVNDARLGAAYTDDESYAGRYGIGTAEGACPTSYMFSKMTDPNEYPRYSGMGGEQKCFKGKYCLDCNNPRFPGYPLSDLYSFIDPTPYSNLATPNRGRLRAMSLNDDALAFSFVLNDKDILIIITQKNVYIADDDGNFTNLTEVNNIQKVILRNTVTSPADIVKIKHDTGGIIAAMRQTFGKHFVCSKGTSEVQFYSLELKGETTGSITIDKDTFVTKEYTYELIERKQGTAVGQKLRSIPTQLGAEFYIWWPGPDLLLSRLYNQRNFELIPFNNKTYESFGSLTDIDKELLIDYSDVPNFEILGDILADPAFHDGLMYVPLKATSNLDAISKYYVNIYSTKNLPWEITIEGQAMITEQILSIASFSEGVMITCKGNKFYKISSTGGASAVTPTYTETANCIIESYFVQARPSPDVPNESPPVYYFCHPYEIMNATLSGTLTLDSANRIKLPPDTRLPLPYDRGVPGSGDARFNLNYPYDISGPFLINFGVYKTSMETGYKHEIWNTLDLSYINLISNYSRHFQIEIEEDLSND
ncbi:MAG: hypothetical protein ACRCTF_04295 [Bacteroidales bacterium]